MKDLDDFSKFLTDEELAKVAPMLERLTTLDKRADQQENYMSFVKHVWPQFIEGSHHKCRLVIRNLSLRVTCFQLG